MARRSDTCAHSGQGGAGGTDWPGVGGGKSRNQDAWRGWAGLEKEHDRRGWVAGIQKGKSGAELADPTRVREDERQ